MQDTEKVYYPFTDSLKKELDEALDYQSLNSDAASIQSKYNQFGGKHYNIYFILNSFYRNLGLGSKQNSSLRSSKSNKVHHS